MINANRLFKIGRKTQILEISDRLQVNDFYNVSGNLETTVHGTFSRIYMCLIDTKDGKKDKSRIGEFNFTVETIRKIVKLFGIKNLEEIYLNEDINPIAWKSAVENYNKINKNTNYDFLYEIKVNSYKKDSYGFSPVSKIKLSYEEQMRSIYKWKVNIETGKGIANMGAAAFKEGALQQGTYQKLYTTFINISTDELINLMVTAASHINLWEKANYSTMLKNKQEFIKRFKENGYNENNIKEWNNDPFKKESNFKKKEFSFKEQNYNQNQNGNQINKQQNAQQNKQQDTNKHTCSNCGYVIDQKIKDFSQKTFGRGLCFKCQKEAKSNQQKRHIG